MDTAPSLAPLPWVPACAGTTLWGEVQNLNPLKRDSSALAGRGGVGANLQQTFADKRFGESDASNLIRDPAHLIADRRSVGGRVRRELAQRHRRAVHVRRQQQHGGVCVLSSQQRASSQM